MINQLHMQNSYYNELENHSFNLDSNCQNKFSFKINVMVKEKFSNIFNKQCWLEINQQKPNKFLQQQKIILNILLNNQDHFNSYFRQFYNNHCQLYQWYQLANQKHHQMRDYIFSKFIKKPFLQYKFQLKENTTKNTKTTCKKQAINDFSIYCTRSFNQSPKKKIFTNKNSPLNSNLSSIHIKQQPNQSPYDKQSQQPHNYSSKQQQDYHQLFIKTLDACDGSKYIYYDFGKHQKGYQNRNKYNNFIRGNNYKKNWILKNKSFHEEINRMSMDKENRNQKGQNSTFSTTMENRDKTFHCHKNNLSRFQLVVLNDSTKVQNNKGFKNSLDGLKDSKNKRLVLKRMPHQFGKQKPFSAFQIKAKHQPVIKV